jgi:hypothetical protein
VHDTGNESRVCIAHLGFGNHNCFHEEIKSTLNSANVATSLLVFRLLSGNLYVKIYKTIILHAVLYGCRARSVTLREEDRLTVYEKRVLRGIFGPKREEVARGWRRLHNEELHNVYASPNIIRVIKPRRMRLARSVARIVHLRNAYKILVRKPEGKRPIGILERIFGK